MSLPHDNIRVWYDGLTTSTNPSKKRNTEKAQTDKVKWL